MSPLDGYRVLDLSLLLPGPLATQILRDLGAKVTKIEPPGMGDLIQYWPPLVGDTSAIYLALNRGKERVTIDLKGTEDLERFESMVRETDVVVEGFRPGVLDRLGVGYDRLFELNPRIVLCSITGYGQHGPYSHRAGHDIGYQAIAGVLSLTCGDRAVLSGNSGDRAVLSGNSGDRAACGVRGNSRVRDGDTADSGGMGEIGKEGGEKGTQPFPGVIRSSHGTNQGLPANPQLQVADTAAGAYSAVMLILAALLERQQTGRGRHLDISMSEQLLPLMTASFASASATNSDPVCNGEVLTGGAPCYRIYRTSDGQGVTLGALEPKFWQALVERLCVPELAMAPYMGGPGSDELADQLAGLFASKTRRQWEELFCSVDACFEPILSLSEVTQHAQWIARNSFTSLSNGGRAEIRVPKMPASLAGFDTEENRR